MKIKFIFGGFSFQLVLYCNCNCSRENLRNLIDLIVSLRARTTLSLSHSLPILYIFTVLHRHNKATFYGVPLTTFCTQH